MSDDHVVHVVTSQAFAGVERYVLDSALTLRESGWRVTVIGGAESAMSAVLHRHGVEWLPGGTVVQSVRSLRAVQDADLINAHMTAAELAAVMVGSRRKIPIVSTRHFGSKRGSSLPPAVGQWLGRRISAQIAISNFVAEQIEGPSEVIHTGVTDVANGPVGSRERQVLLLQRLEPEKATDEALRAWAEIPDRKGWRLVVAGEGSLRASLEALAKRLEIADSVDFIGFQADVRPVLARAGILLAPTPREGLGISVIEAMASGTPVVAAAGGGHFETVGGVDEAALYSPGDVAKAAQLLTGLMDDDDLRSRYGAALRERQRAEFSRSRQTARTLEVFDSVLAKRRPR